jgi:PTH2 family peptidyl-tRNA hydrolase
MDDIQINRDCSYYNWGNCYPRELGARCEKHDQWFRKDEFCCENCEINSDELVQYFVINSELNMSPGKIAVQVAHVAVIIIFSRKDLSFISKSNIEEYNNNKRIKDWYKKDQKKIILRGKQKDLEKLVEQGFYYIKDIGLTEVPAGSLTCVGLPPMYKSEAQPYIKRLQLL